MTSLVHCAIDAGKKKELEEIAKKLTEKWKIKVSLSNVVRIAIDQYLENEKVMKEYIDEAKQ